MAEETENAPESNQSPQKHSGGGGFCVIIALLLPFALPLLAFIIIFAIIPRGLDLKPVQGAAAVAITGDGCAHYSGTKLTAYWTPDNWSDYGNNANVRKTEGGPNDRKGKRNHTLREYIAGKYNNPAQPTENYVSLAGDYTAGSPFSQYGIKVYIPSIESAMAGGKEIIFRVVDTGGDFVGKGSSRLDVAVFTQSEMSQSAINATTDIYVGEGCQHGSLTGTAATNTPASK